LQQTPHDRLRCELDRGRLLPEHALAVVVELGLQPLQVLEVGLRLRASLGEVVDDVLALGLRLRLGGGAGRLGRLLHIANLGVPVAVRHEALTSIVLGLAVSALGTEIVRTPFSNRASIPSASAVLGRRTERANAPKLRSIRCQVSPFSSWEKSRFPEIVSIPSS